MKPVAVLLFAAMAVAGAFFGEREWIGMDGGG
jgi:hypothetical protein